jgi:two-component system CheB/CheR fusion protein
MPTEVNSRPKLTPPCPIVAIGASAGGLDACRRLLDVVAPDSGCAFIIVQHLDRSHDSLLADLLASHTAMPVVEARHDAAIEPNHVYVIAPGTALTVASGRLHVGQPDAAHGAHLPIDELFRSLAAGDATHATAIILSGTGSDGSDGLAVLHANRGRIIAQDPDEAAFAGMPQAAIDTGLVDRICRIADMAAALTASRTVLAPPIGVETAPKWLAAIIDLLRTTATHDFRLYKTGTLERRIERRMGMAGIKAAQHDRYLDLLRGDEAERNALANYLLINVTSFFRDPAVFDELARTIIPDLVRNQPVDRPLRLWIAGCSTGEETFSLMMLFHEAIAFDNRGVRPHGELSGDDRTGRLTGAAGALLRP